jgi:multiple sugar transport system substrate-binding protein
VDRCLGAAGGAGRPRRGLRGDPVPHDRLRRQAGCTNRRVQLRRRRQGCEPRRAKEFVKWLWGDQEEYQVDFPNSYGTHIPAKTPLAPRADKLASGAGAEAAKFVAEFGHGPDLLWTPGIQQAYTSALNNVVKKKADPEAEIAKVAETAQAGIKRVNG